MTYKAVRTERFKYIHWVNRGTGHELDEMYDLERDPYEIRNIVSDEEFRSMRISLQAELRKLSADALGMDNYGGRS